MGDGGGGVEIDGDVEGVESAGEEEEEGWVLGDGDEIFPVEMGDE